MATSGGRRGNATLGYDPYNEYREYVAYQDQLNTTRQKMIDRPIASVKDLAFQSPRNRSLRRRCLLAVDVLAGGERREKMMNVAHGDVDDYERLMQVEDDTQQQQQQQ